MPRTSDAPEAAPHAVDGAAPGTIPGPDGSWKLKLACVWGGELVSVLTSSILQMGFIWHITLATNSASMLSLASLMGFLPLALLGSVAGAIVDRLPLKRVLIGADFFIAAVSALVALASMAGSLPVWMVIVALFFRAIGSAFHTPAFQALTPLVAPPERLTRLAGVTQLVQSGGYILGTAAAAAIYPVWGLTAMVALDVAGALFASVAVLAARLSGRPAAPVVREGLATQVRQLARETAEGYRVLRRYRGLFALLWCGFAFTLVFSPISALFPIMTLGHFAGTTADAALAEVVFSVGMIAGSMLLAATGGFANRALSVVASCAVYGVATLAAGLLGPDGFMGFLAASAVMGLSSPFYSGPADRAHARTHSARVPGARFWPLREHHGLGLAGGARGVDAARRYGGRAHLVRARRFVHVGARCDHLVDSEHQAYRARAVMNLSGAVRHTSLSMRSSSAAHPSSTSR